MTYHAVMHALQAFQEGFVVKKLPNWKRNTILNLMRADTGQTQDRGT